MTQTLVRYSAEVEQNEPDLERSLQTVPDDMKRHMRGSLQAEGGSGACGVPAGSEARAAHQKLEGRLSR